MEKYIFSKIKLDSSKKATLLYRKRIKLEEKNENVQAAEINESRARKDQI
jgi:hypothetical protein